MKKLPTNRPVSGCRIARRGPVKGSRAILLMDLRLLAEQLADDELAVLVTLAARVSAGQARYGRLDLGRDRRNFRREAAEEVTDACFYLATEVLRIARRFRG